MIKAVLRMIMITGENKNYPDKSESVPLVSCSWTGKATLSLLSSDTAARLVLLVIGVNKV